MMFDEKINVAEIMQQIKDEVSQRYHTGNSPSFPVYDADYPAAKTLDEIDALAKAQAIADRQIRCTNP